MEAADSSRKSTAGYTRADTKRTGSTAGTTGTNARARATNSTTAATTSSCIKINKMALGRPLGDFAQQFNSVYNIKLDLSGWDKTTITVIPPISGAIYVYGTNDSGAVQGVTQGNAS